MDEHLLPPAALMVNNALYWGQKLEVWPYVIIIVTVMLMMMKIRNRGRRR